MQRPVIRFLNSLSDGTKKWHCTKEKNDEENSTNNTIFDAKLVALWQLIRSYR